MAQKTNADLGTIIRHPTSLLPDTDEMISSPQPTWGTFAAQVVRKVSGDWKAKERTTSTKMKSRAATNMKRRMDETRVTNHVLLVALKNNHSVGIVAIVTMALACQSLLSIGVGNS
jgi:hypothetical protein